jgi:hypothetical protein
MRKWSRRLLDPDRFANLAAKLVGEKHDHAQ